MIGAVFSSSCLSPLNKDEVLTGLSGMMKGAFGSIFAGALQGALDGCSRRGILVDKRGKDGFFLEDIFNVI